MTREVILSLCEESAEATARRFSAVPPGCARVEIRADRLRASDIAGLVARSPRPVLVAARRSEEGGQFDRSEPEREEILSAALAAGAWIDVEWGSAAAALAEGTAAERVVLSRHGDPCHLPSLLSVYQEMAGTRARHLKLVPRADRPSQGAAVRALLAHARQDGRALACFALGEAGTATRVLALAWGSWATYGSAERGMSTAEGQLPASTLLDVFGAPSLGEHTRLYGLVGAPLARSPSPAMHHAGYRALGLDACYLPFPTDDPDEVQAVVEAYGLAGFGVTIPLKEALASRCALADAVSSAAGAVNTITVGDQGWAGYNTDGPAARALLAGVLDLAGARALLLGAGGTAAGIGAALRAAGARVTVCGRTAERARALARRIGAAALPWAERASTEWDVLVQATPLGAQGEEVLPRASLQGQAVLDAAYGEGTTPLVADARARGLIAFTGSDLLVAQGALQFARLTGRDVAVNVLRRAAGVA